MSTSWFSVPVPNARARARLFCMPYAGSGASCYHAWSRALAADGIEVRSVQLPGRESRLREPALTALGPLVSALTDQIAPLADRPFGFFGHSMGALVAFEVARELRRRHITGPGFLCASGAGAPQVPRDEAPLHTLPDQEFVRQVSEKYQGIPPQVLQHQELLELVLPALRADLTVIENYQFVESEPLPCPLLVFSGEGDEHVTPAKLALWEALTSGRFECRTFPGDHFFLNDNRDALINAVRVEFQRMERPAAC